MVLSFTFTACEKAEELLMDEDITAHFDPNFARVLEDYGYIQNADKITRADVDKITKLDFAGCELTSLVGIEYFTELNGLYLTGTGLSDLDLSKNTKLTELVCVRIDRDSNFSLKTLNISGCVSLNRLYCYNNELTILDISKNTKLTELFCFSNLLTYLDISKNTSLTELRCGDNPGDGIKFIVKAWFDNNNIPNGFPKPSSFYEYQKVN
jgi:Leucine-rich repeat (LRR) protein